MDLHLCPPTPRCTARQRQGGLPAAPDLRQTASEASKDEAARKRLPPADAGMLRQPPCAAKAATRRHTGRAPDRRTQDRNPV